MNIIIKNKKIKFLNILEKILTPLIQSIVILLMLYINGSYFKNESTMFTICYLLISLGVFASINYLIKILIGKITKEEYIKINPEIKYLKEIPKAEIFNIEKYIEKNKEKLDLKV